MLILGIESSCDETAAAVVAEGTVLMSNIVASQVDIHGAYGGVVPEIASRKHIEAIIPVISQALRDASVSLDDIEGIAVTSGPGLIGSILVGLAAAKSIAFAKGVPFVGVNHLEGHVSAIFLTEDRPAFPFIALVVSGGHTSLYHVRNFGEYRTLGRTRDDAAGEAFDKAAKMLGLGYPGGVVIDSLAVSGNSDYVVFPRPMRGSADFSFSGLKTALLNYIKKRELPIAEEEMPHIAASFQEAVVDVLVAKAVTVAEKYSIPRIVVAGGVAANSRLRLKLNEEAGRRAISVFMPPLSLCTDNAAMIAAAGHHYLVRGKRDSLSLNALSRWSLDSLKKDES